MRGEKKNHRVEVWQGKQQLWWWHRKAGNNRIVSDCGEGYTRRSHCLRMAKELNPGVKIRLEP